jgi:hypothetical protein
MAKDVVNEINKRYVKMSNRVTHAYEKTFGLPCDLYFPIFDPYNEKTKYRDMKIFTPHQSPTYSKEPDVRNAIFYIPFLIPKEAMNSSEVDYDSFFTESTPERPFIETSKKRELPIATKVVVHQGRSIIKFFVDKKLVVTGADGMMLLRMYLSPLAKDDDTDEEFQEETTIEGTDYSPKPEEGSVGGGLGSGLGSTRSVDVNSEEEEVNTLLDEALGNNESIETAEEPVKKTRKRKATTASSTPKKRTTRKKKVDTVASVDSNLTMNIPED